MLKLDLIMLTIANHQSINHFESLKHDLTMLGSHHDAQHSVATSPARQLALRGHVAGGEITPRAGPVMSRACEASFRVSPSPESPGISWRV